MSAQLGRVLVVDDNENNREILARRLARKGYTVSVAESARDLLDRVLIDSELNDHAFIVPGLGDAGDRQFGSGG